MAIITTVRGTHIQFKSSGGNAAFNPSGITTGSGRQSAAYDRGASAATNRYEWTAVTRANAVPAVGGVVAIYLAQGSSVDSVIYTDGNLSQIGAALPALDRRRNLKPIGVVTADEASTTQIFIASDECIITGRYVSVVWINELGVALHATATEHLFVLTPLTEQVV